MRMSYENIASLRRTTRKEGLRMKLTSAIAKLEKAGFKIVTNGNFYIAEKEGVTVNFISSEKGEVKSNGFSWESETSCAKTYGMTLKQVIS